MISKVWSSQWCCEACAWRLDKLSINSLSGWDLLWRTFNREFTSQSQYISTWFPSKANLHCILGRYYRAAQGILLQAFSEAWDNGIRSGEEVEKDSSGELIEGFELSKLGEDLFGGMAAWLGMAYKSSVQEKLVREILRKLRLVSPYFLQVIWPHSPLCRYTRPHVPQCFNFNDVWLVFTPFWHFPVSNLHGKSMFKMQFESWVLILWRQRTVAWFEVLRLSSSLIRIFCKAWIKHS